MPGKAIACTVIFTASAAVVYVSLRFKKIVCIKRGFQPNATYASRASRATQAKRLRIFNASCLLAMSAMRALRKILERGSKAGVCNGSEVA